jgi:hypothetical protein
MQTVSNGTVFFIFGIIQLPNPHCIPHPIIFFFVTTSQPLFGYLTPTPLLEERG